MLSTQKYIKGKNLQSVRKHPTDIRPQADWGSLSKQAQHLRDNNIHLEAQIQSKEEKIQSLQQQMQEKDNQINAIWAELRNLKQGKK